MAMAPALPNRGPSSIAAQAKSTISLSDIKQIGNKLPNRTVLHALEGWGKTSWAAQFPSPIFLQSKGETGLETLIDAGRLPQTPHFPELMTWADVLQAVKLLRESEHNFKTAVFDTLNGLERLCHEHVCARDFGNAWDDKGFLGYMRGYEVSLADWRELLTALDDLRATRRMRIIGICHTKVTTFKNPEGPDYDRYQPDMHAKTWSLTHKWSDVVLCGLFSTTVATAKGGSDQMLKKGKGTGGQTRIIYTERTAAFDAKNRIGLPAEIEMGDSAKASYDLFIAAAKAARPEATEPQGGSQ